MKTFSACRPLLTSLLVLATLTATAGPRPSKAVPTNGYWNLETNLTTRNHTIVRFYNNLNQLVYEERLDNLCLDLSKGNGLCRRTAKQLNVALQDVLRAPGSTPQTNLLATQFGQSRRVQRVYAVR